MTLLFVFLVTLYFSSVFFFRNKISSKSNKVRQCKTELSPMISEFLFYEENAKKNEKSNYLNLKIEIRQLLKNDFNRKVLSEILLDLRKDLSGDTQRRLFKLYTDLGLHTDAFEKLKSWRWEVVSKGILELTQMQVLESYSFITKFINDKRSTIRKQAEIATVTLKHEGINYFLDTTKFKISEWQQLKLLDVLKNKEDYRPPLFKVWLTSRNKHVVLFALRLIKYYRQNDAKVSLIELVKHKDDQIKEEALQCVKEFNILEAFDTLQLVFWKNTVEIKISILDAIASIGDKTCIPFLQSIAQKESNFSVKGKAISALNTISPESILPTEDIQHMDSYNIPKDIETEWPFSDSKDLIDESKINNEGSIAESSNDVEDQIEKNRVEFGQFIRQKCHTPLEIESSDATTKIQAEPFLNIDFIPLVTEDVIETDQSSKEFESMTDERMQKTELQNIEIIIEEVVAMDSKNKKDKDIFHLEVSELDFLPIVITNEGEEQESPNSHQENIENSSIDVLPDAVSYKEVSADPMETACDKTAEIDELHFLPIVTYEDDHSNNEVSEPIYKEFPQSLEHIDYTMLPNMEIIYDEVVGQPYMGEESTSETRESVSQKTGQPIVNDVVSWLLAYNEIREIELSYEELSETDSLLDMIPKPLYYNKHEAEMMALLDDLEELGDHREIPLLNELWTQETVPFIKARLGEIIEVFSMEREIKIEPEIEPELNESSPVFSVFEDLFRSCDTEKKLILMDEIIAVGDEKEIAFLDGLLEDPNFKIRNKAHIVLEGLFKKLAIEKDFSIEEDSSKRNHDQKNRQSNDAQALRNSDPKEDTLFLDSSQANDLDYTDIFNVTFEISEDFDA